MTMSVSEDFTVEGFFVTSDFKKDKYLYFVSLAIVCHIFETIGNDYPSLLSMKRNQATGAVEMVWKS